MEGGYNSRVSSESGILSSKNSVDLKERVRLPSIRARSGGRGKVETLESELVEDRLEEKENGSKNERVRKTKKVCFGGEYQYQNIMGNIPKERFLRI